MAKRIKVLFEELGEPMHKYTRWGPDPPTVKERGKEENFAHCKA